MAETIFFGALLAAMGWLLYGLGWLHARMQFSKHVFAPWSNEHGELIARREYAACQASQDLYVRRWNAYARCRSPLPLYDAASPDFTIGDHP